MSVYPSRLASDFVSIFGLLPDGMGRVGVDVFKAVMKVQRRSCKMSFRDKVAIVTGGAQGIGKCIALTLLREGMCVVIADLDEEAGAECVEEYSPIGRIAFIPTQVNQESAVENCVRKTVEMFGRLDAIVNNAGIGTGREIEKLTLEEWNTVIGTNLTSCFLMTKYGIAHLRKSKGAIVNIASIKGFLAIASEAHSESYCAAKGGVIALTHALAISQGPSVRVNCISPGWIVTDTWRKKRMAGLRKLSAENHAQHPVGRVGWPEDIAGMVRYLLSDEAGFITGQNFVVDGGMSKKLTYPS